MRRHRLSRRCATAAAVCIAALTLPRTTHAQDTTTARDSDPVCLGFAFGAWTPKLDWKAVGHAPMPVGAPTGDAPEGRDWAALPSDVAGDTALTLFPRWWPAGVAVALPTRTPAPGDTVVGRAWALVPSFKTTAPESRVRAWRVPCRSSR